MKKYFSSYSFCCVCLFVFYSQYAQLGCAQPLVTLRMGANLKIFWGFNPLTDTNTCFITRLSCKHLATHVVYKIM